MKGSMAICLGVVLALVLMTESVSADNGTTAGAAPTTAGIAPRGGGADETTASAQVSNPSTPDDSGTTPPDNSIDVGVGGNQDEQNTKPPVTGTGTDAPKPPVTTGKPKSPGGASALESMTLTLIILLAFGATRLQAQS